MKPEWTLGADGQPVTIHDGSVAPTSSRPWNDNPRDPKPPWEQDCVAVQSCTLEAPDQVEYDKRIGLRSKKFLTIIRPSDAVWIVKRVAAAIAGKVVVEVGAGVGVMATALAAHAKHVFAIEADPMWSWTFARHMYQTKPANLTYILDNAENLLGVLKADVAICVTGSDEVNLRRICEGFAPQVFMPWQDWNDGKAVSQWSIY